jgi:hypothetical protein
MSHVAGAAVRLQSFADLGPFITADTNLQFGDYLPFYRQTSAVFGGKVVGLPLDGDLYLMYYRCVDCSDVRCRCSNITMNQWYANANSVAVLLHVSLINATCCHDILAAVHACRHRLVHKWPYSSVFHMHVSLVDQLQALTS